MTPARGEVWLFDLGMAAKVRPALIISVDYGDADRALVTIRKLGLLKQEQFERVFSGLLRWLGYKSGA